MDVRERPRTRESSQPQEKKPGHRIGFTDEFGMGSGGSYSLLLTAHVTPKVDQNPALKGPFGPFHLIFMSDKLFSAKQTLHNNMIGI